MFTALFVIKKGVFAKKICNIGKDLRTLRTRMIINCRNSP